MNCKDVALIFQERSSIDNSRKANIFSIINWNHLNSFFTAQNKGNILVCGHLPDTNRYPMENNFSQDNFVDFVLKFTTNLLQPFLFSETSKNSDLEVGIEQIDAYELKQLVEEEEDKAILLLSEKNELSESFQQAALKLRNEISFVWMNLTKNEIAPNLVKIFTTFNTSIYVKTNGKIMKFIPVSKENNLLELLTKFIKQRKLHLHYSK